VAAPDLLVGRIAAALAPFIGDPANALIHVHH
jgi:hypothetical protein